MIDAHRIVYNNLSSDEFDVILGLSFGGDDGATSSFLGREGVYTEHYDGHHIIHRAKYNGVFTPRFTLIKKDYSDFDPSENRRILSWLTASEKPVWLEVYKDDSNVMEWRVFGCVTTVEQYKLGNGRIVGYEFEVESSHPYAWSRSISYPETLDDNDEITNYLQVNGKKYITITCNTDEYNKPLYPKVTVTFKGKNTYFPIDVNPLQENTYPMVPNVIYSWLEKYRKATDYTEGVTYYSDENGTVANPQPSNATEITNGKYYIYVNQTHLYVNLNNTEHNGRYAIQALDSNEIIQEHPPMEYTYYYLPDGYINKLVKDDNNNWVWKPIVQIGMAVKISNTYVAEGVSTTKESIIAGGTMDEVIILDGTNKLVSGTKGTTARIIGDSFNWDWIPFVYGENKITVEGNCAIKFEWIEPRKVGSL